MTEIYQAPVLAAFSCLGDKCADTCCKGWSMQMDETTLARYRSDAPELLAAVEPGNGSDSDAPWIMRKDPQSGFCVKLEGGLCGIHKTHGTEFLGDACHFYPRVTRALGEKAVMTASLSCPEIARLAFAQEQAPAFNKVDVERLPHTLKNRLPDGMSSDDALAVHQMFLAAATDANAPFETIFARIGSVARSLDRVDKKDWVQATPIYMSLAEGSLPPAQPNINDPFNLLHALCGLIVATRKPPSERLRQTIAEMEQALCASLDWKQVLIHTDENSLPAYQKISALWKKEGAQTYDPILKRVLAMQLSLALFPFAGLGDSLSERITIIGVRMATFKLALMCACAIHETGLPSEMVVRLVQALARFLDHLGDPAFSLQIYAETGWNQEARMRGLLEI
jgi:lysine-N-methylase